MFAQQHAGELLEAVLFDYSAQRLAEIKPSDRLVHYTSQETVEKIVRGDPTKGRSLWLRDSKAMNDYSEVRWGQHCLSEAFRDWRLIGRLRRVLDAISPTVFEPLMSALIKEQYSLGDAAYLLSLSIHDAQECRSGKLSMWRAYGTPHSACLVFNTGPFMRYQSAHEVVLSPVMYATPDSFCKEFEGLLYRLEKSAAMLRAIEPELLLFNLKRALDFAVLSIKHAGFHEENEWRLIHQHSNFRPDPPSHRAAVGGVENIYEIPMKNFPDQSLWGAELDEVLDYIIVGPANNPEKVCTHFVGLLRECGVTMPEERVLWCGIPLRVSEW